MNLRVASLFVLLATGASAQAPVPPSEASTPPPAAPTPPPEAPSQAPGPLSEPPLPSAADPCTTVEADYTAAFDDLVKGADEKALAALERVLAACPTHPYAGEFARLVRARLGPGAKLAEAALTGPEQPTGFARGGLLVWQTMHGAAQGLLLCGIADCESRGALGAALLGASIGAGTSWLMTKNGITPGQSAAINSGTTWGVWYGLVAITVFELDDDGALGTVMASMAALTTAGIGLAVFNPPTAGQVSLANSGGLWSGVVMALFLFTSDNSDEETFMAVESVVTGLGLTTFALLSRSYPVSRGRVLLIDAGGILGGLLGAATVALLSEDGDAILIGSAVGALGGLGLTTWITRDFDGPPDSGPQVTLAPTLMGRQGAGLVLGGRF
jgi:hypothetical protein